MNSSQEMRFQSLFCSDPATEALGAELWLMRAGMMEFWDVLIYLGRFTNLLSLHLLSSFGKWASRRYVTRIRNKVKDNTLKRQSVLASPGQIC